MAKQGKFSKGNFQSPNYTQDYQNYGDYQNYSQDAYQDYSQDSYNNVPQEDSQLYYDAPKSKKRKHSPLWLKIFVFLLILALSGVVALGYLAMQQMNSHPEVKTTAAYRSTVKDYTMDELLAMADNNEDYAASSVEQTVPYADGNYGSTGKVINILVVGQDAREGENQGKNSDTMILCSLNKETKVLHLSSFLRDSYVQIASYKGKPCGTYRINAAYSLGYLWGGDAGAFELINDTIRNNFGATIDHNIEVSLSCFQSIIDAIGGIDVELDADEAKYMTTFVGKQGYDVSYEAGPAHLYGVGALVYARMRHETPGGSDMKRTNRQRVVVSQVIERCKKMSVAELNDLIKEILGYVITDMTDEEITAYIMDCLPVLPYLTVESRQFPMDGTYAGKMLDIDNNGMLAGVLVPYDLPKNQKVLKAICAGEDIPE